MSERKRDLLWLAAGVLLLIAAVVFPKPWQPVLYLAAFVCSGWQVLFRGCKSICRGDVFNENTLMIVAAIGAFCIGEYVEAVFVVVFYRVGELFEDYAVQKTRASIRDVLEICPDTANLLTEEGIRTVDPDTVQIGDVIVAAAGERVPLDGVVMEGRSFLDTSALTGESVPRSVEPGQEILSGCINCQGVLKIRVTKTFEDSTASRILELVETASARKSRSERFITRFARVYTPVVLLCAVLLAVVPPLVLPGAAFRDYLYRALSFLVVSCPCALVISVPLAFFGGIGGAARQGVLIKGGSWLEALSKADQMVFDKTGTLTEGSFTVRQVLSAAMREEELLELAACAEHASEHPIARSVRQAWGKPIDTGRISYSEELPGRGVRAVIDGKTVLAGNITLLAEAGIDCPVNRSGTCVHVAAGDVYAGTLVLADAVKPHAKQTVAALRKIGIRKFCMLSGDRRETAEAIGRELGLDQVKSELLPADKVRELEALMAETGGTTVYVGDGINDAPVLARADVSIAMGALGSDAAVEAADLVIMTDEVEKIETAVRIARKTMAVARQNILFSVVIKVGILALCSLNVLGMGAAVFGDVGVMVMAVLNSFRTLRV